MGTELIMKALRARLYQSCLDFIHTRIDTAQTALTQAREAANDDTKSSAGDKFETTREMMQQELDRNKRLLFDAETQHQLLLKIESFTASEIIRPGSIVHTSTGNFFVSISAGQVNIDGIIYFAVSPSSPVGNALLGKKAGETAAFSGREYRIIEVG